MAIGTSKVGALGGLVPGGTCTFNASGTFVVPPGVKKVSVTGQGGSGNPGNAGNSGNAGNPGKGGTGGGGSKGPNNGPPNSPGAPGGWGFNAAPLGLPNLNRGGGRGGQVPCNAPVAPDTGASGNAGPSGSAGNAGTAGNPGNTGTASTVFCIPFAGGNGGTGGNAGAAGNGGTGGGGGGGGSGSSGAGGSGGGGAGSPGSPLFELNPPSPTLLGAMGGGGGGGAGVNSDGTAGSFVLPPPASPRSSDNGILGGAGGKTSGFGVPAGPNAPAIVPGNTFGSNHVGPFDTDMSGGPGGGGNTGDSRVAGGGQFGVGKPPGSTFPSANSANGFTCFTPCKNYRGAGVPNPLVNAVSCGNSAFRSGSGGGSGNRQVFIGTNGAAGGGGAGGGRGNAGNAGGTGGSGNPGNAGATNSPVPTNCVPVTPGASYPVVVGTSGQIVISWNPQ